MSVLPPLTILLAFLTAGALSLIVLFAIGLFPLRHPKSSAPGTARLLFRDGLLVDSDRILVSESFDDTASVESWDAFRNWLDQRFGPLAKWSETGSGTMTALDPEDSATLSLDQKVDGLHVLLRQPNVADPIHLHRAWRLEQLASQCLDILGDAPCAMRCRNERTGAVWHNKAFAGFSDGDIAAICSADVTGTQPERIRLPGTQTDQERYVQLSAGTAGDMSVLYVNDVTQVARAEIVRREFIQTLTKTFANLTTGLAVFDRHRSLALFNPALMDLTGLSASFLSAQPAMTRFFDRLRDQKVLPEPRNYESWRNHIDEIITSASDGLYFEDWSLPNNVTYRVTGRPHPDGAIAFLIEDISDEVALTRRFRNQIDVRQAALDACDQALTIIGPTNVVLLCNKPASVLLGIDPDSSFAEMSVQDFLQACAERLPDDKFWANAETNILKRTRSHAVVADVAGRPHTCLITPVRGNSSLVSISSDAKSDTMESGSLKMLHA